MCSLYPFSLSADPILPAAARTERLYPRNNQTSATPKAMEETPMMRSCGSPISGMRFAISFKSEGASAYTSPSMIRKNAIPVRKSATDQLPAAGTDVVAGGCAPAAFSKNRKNSELGESTSVVSEVAPIDC